MSKRKRRAFTTLMKSIWRSSNGEYVISPQAFRSQIQKFAPRFMGYSQQDSQEFLHYLLQGLQEDINRITTRPRHLTTEIDDNLSKSQKAAEAWKRYLRYDDSKIVDCFVGQLKSTLKCSVCGHKSVTFDPFWDLSLPIPKGSDPVTLQQCLSLFAKEEVLGGDEKPCFMNSIVQCLVHTRPLLEYCLKDGYVSEINTSTSSMKGALLEAFATLMKSIWRSSNGEYAISPQAFRSQIQKFAPRFMGYSQQDSQEFLHYLLQGPQEDISRITTRSRHLTTEIDDNLSESQKAAEAWKRYLRYDDSKIVDCFVGQLKSTLKCSVCGHKSVTFDPFWDLSLPIPKGSDSVTLQQCLSLFTKEEVLDGDEKPACSHCKTRQKCTKSFTIHRCPKILVLHLKRFSPSERFRAKLNTRVEFPLTNLDLCPYMSNSHYVMYNLYAVSNHSGSTYSGHYTATCLHPKSGEWHECNDTKISGVSASRVVSSEAYVLFYEAATQSSSL